MNELDRSYDPDSELLDVFSSGNVGVIGLSLMRDGIFTDQTRKYVQQGVRFLEFVRENLQQPPHQPQSEQPVHDRQAVLRLAGVEPNDPISLMLFLQRVEGAYTKIQQLAAGQNDRTVAEETWRDVRVWADWYFKARSRDSQLLEGSFLVKA